MGIGMVIAIAAAALIIGALAGVLVHVAILKAMGVFDALKAAGVKEGDTVKIGHLEFDYLY